MKRLFLMSSLLVTSLVAAPVMAGERQDAVVGAVIGSGAGALIGHSLSGRDGALFGGALGAMAGVAIATSDRGPSTRTVVHERVVYPVQKVVVVKEPPRRVVVVHEHRHGKGPGWKKAYAYQDHRGYDRHDRRWR